MNHTKHKEVLTLTNLMQMGGKVLNIDDDWQDPELFCMRVRLLMQENNADYAARIALCDCHAVCVPHVLQEWFRRV